VTLVSSADELVAEIRAAIESAATGPPAPDRKFNKNDEFVAYGLNVPVWRKIMREFWPRLRALSPGERLDLAEGLFAEGEGWLGHSARNERRAAWPSGLRAARPDGGALHRLVACG